MPDESKPHNLQQIVSPSIHCIPNENIQVKIVLTHQTHCVETPLVISNCFSYNDIAHLHRKAQGESLLMTLEDGRKKLIDAYCKHQKIT